MLSRLLWKEYRTQRGLWFSVFGITLVMQAALVACMPSRDQSLEMVFHDLSWIMPLLFALGAPALCFVFEREEGLDVVGFRLPIAPTVTLLAKLLVVTGGAVALLGASVACGELGWLVVKLRGGSFAASDISAEATLRAALALLTWGTVFSLVGRRTINCIFATAVAAFVEVSVLQESLHRGVPVNVIAMGLWIAALAFDFWWAQRWTEQRVPRLVESLLKWLPFAATERRSSVALTDSRVIARDEQRLASQRINARLRWFEWRRARWMLGLGLLSVPYLLWSGSEMSSRVSEGFWFPALLCWTLTALCGLCSFGLDQQRQRFGVFTQLGVSPRRLWLMKSLVWGGVASVLVTAILLTAAETHPIDMANIYIPTLAWDDSNVLVSSNDYDARLRAYLWRMTLSDGVTYGVTMPQLLLLLGTCFGLGQLGGVLGRYVVMGLGASGFLVISFAIWSQMRGVYALPPLFCTVPLSLAMLWAVDRSVRLWLDQRRSFREVGKLLLGGAAGLVVSLGVLITYRWIEIPDGGDPIELSQLEPPSAAAVQRGKELRAIAESVIGVAIPNFEERQKRLETDDYHSVARSVLLGTDPDARQWCREFAAENQEALKRLPDALSQIKVPQDLLQVCLFDPTAKVDPARSYNASWQHAYERTTQLLEAAAVDAVNRGEPQQALEFCALLGKFVSSAVPYAGMEQLSFTLRQRMNAIETFCWCLLDERLTADDREKAFWKFRNAIHVPTGPTMRVDYFPTGGYPGDAFDWDYLRSLNDERWPEYLEFWSKTPWEQARRERLRRAFWRFNKMSQHQVDDLNSTAMRRLNSWHWTTSAAVTFHEHDPHTARWVKQTDRRAANRFAALTLQFLLLQHRAKHGRLPNELHELLSDAEVQLPRFEKARCEYFANGMPNGFGHSVVPIKPGAPLLLIVDEEHGRAEPQKTAAGIEWTVTPYDFAVALERK